VESTVVEVLIPHGLREGGFYKVVIRVGLKILIEFDGLRGGGAWLAGARTGAAPEYSHKV
jgi:hypothetical protein